MRSIFAFLSSIRLTLFLLSASLVLIFFGTLDQVHFGIYHTQQKYFEHFLVVWQYPRQWLFGDVLAWLQLPLPGGYLLGPLLVANLACAHFRYFRPSWRKAGIPLIHGGLVLLLIGQLWTQLRQKEYFMWLAEGERRNFVESFHYDELVLIDVTDAGRQRVFSWDGRALQSVGSQLSHPELPFRIDVLWYAHNAAIFPRPPEAANLFPQMPATRGIGAERDLVAVPQRPTFAEGERNVKTAFVRIAAGDEDLGTWLVANTFRDNLPMRESFPAQRFEYDGRTWELSLRFTRAYLPAYLELRKFRHDRYPGTDIPFNFSSDVRIHELDTGKARDTLIYMNHPLRYAGLTFYQASFADNDTRSMFQVVSNPARWFPYIASAIMTAGLCIQFLISLYLHARKRRPQA